MAEALAYVGFSQEFIIEASEQGQYSILDSMVSY